MLIMADLRKDDTRNLLTDIGLLAGLTPTQLDWVAQRAHRRVFGAGHNVMIVEQGARDVILSILGAGDLLGEMSLIHSVGRSASAVTLEDSLMLWMNRLSFHYILDNFPPVARNLVRILSARVRLSDQLIQALATLDVNGRVARQLLAFAEKYGREKNGSTQIRIVLTQSDIADLVGASRKRVNQAMVSFREQGLIDTDAEGRINIRDHAGLGRYCN